MSTKPPRRPQEKLNPEAVKPEGDKPKAERHLSALFLSFVSTYKYWRTTNEQNTRRFSSSRN